MLLRRASPQAFDGVTRSVRRVAFMLRPSRDESELSFYDASRVSPVEVLTGAPGEGWGVVAITAGELRSLGFTLRRDSRSGDRTAEAHVLARPATTDDGQIPAEVRLAIAIAALWMIEPQA
ncbi:MAG: hypothetical protein U0837_07140 [Dehalococcoidia bacterium]|jgi:hypothetical protein